MQPVYIVGVGSSRFDHHWELSLEHLAAHAIQAALKDAEIGRDDIDFAYVSHMSQGEIVGQRVLKQLDFPEIPVVNIENACAGGGTAFREAWVAIGAGLSDLVLVLGIEKLAQKGFIRFKEKSFEDQLGFVMPASYALAGRRHMSEYGTTVEELAWIASKNRTNGASNERAMFRKACSIEDVLSSPTIVDPLTLLQCCAPASGAAALVLASRSAAERLGRTRVRVRASAVASRMNRSSPEDLTIFRATARAAQAAYELSGIGPEEADVVELHDAFSVGELLHYEGLGLCGRGESRRLVSERATAVGGSIPVNPSGGLLARGHPIGATGVAQLAELSLQLRGQASVNQVHAPKVAIAQCQGGTGVGAGAAVVSILSV